MVLNEVSPEFLSRGSGGFTASREWEWLDNGQENPTGPGGGARHCRSNQNLTESEPIREAQSALSHPLHEVGGNPIPESSLHESTSKEEGNDDEPDHLIGEGAEGCWESESLGDDGCGEAQKGPCTDGERAENEARDGGEENGEELPGLGGDFHRFGDEEANNEAYAYGDHKRQGLCTLERCWCWWWGLWSLNWVMGFRKGVEFKGFGFGREGKGLRNDDGWSESWRGGARELGSGDDGARTMMELGEAREGGWGWWWERMECKALHWNGRVSDAADSWFGSELLFVVRRKEI